jgi:hypothetical protein
MKGRKNSSKLYILHTTVFTCFAWYLYLPINEISVLSDFPPAYPLTFLLSLTCLLAFCHINPYQFWVYSYLLYAIILTKPQFYSRYHCWYWNYFWHLSLTIFIINTLTPTIISCNIASHTYLLCCWQSHLSTELDSMTIVGGVMCQQTDCITKV